MGVQAICRKILPEKVFVVASWISQTCSRISQAAHALRLRVHFAFQSFLLTSLDFIDRKKQPSGLMERVNLISKTADETFGSKTLALSRLISTLYAKALLSAENTRPDTSKVGHMHSFLLASLHWFEKSSPSTSELVNLLNTEREAEWTKRIESHATLSLALANAASEAKELSEPSPPHPAT